MDEGWVGVGVGVTDPRNTAQQPPWYLVEDADPRREGKQLQRIEHGGYQDTSGGHQQVRQVLLVQVQSSGTLNQSQRWEHA